MQVPQNFARSALSPVRRAPHMHAAQCVHVAAPCHTCWINRQPEGLLVQCGTLLFLLEQVPWVRGGWVAGDTL